jgi:hypothetical protein
MSEKRNAHASCNCDKLTVVTDYSTYCIRVDCNFWWNMYFWHFTENLAWHNQILDLQGELDQSNKVIHLLPGLCTGFIGCIRTPHCLLSVELDLNMFVFTHTFLHAFSGLQLLKVGTCVSPRQDRCKCCYFVFSIIILLEIKPHTQLTAVFDNEQPPIPSPTNEWGMGYSSILAFMTN